MADRREMIRRFRESWPIRMAKSVLRSPAQLYFFGLDRLTRNRRDHHLVIAAIFKDEAPFLNDWIRFHLGQGVERIYLYNNGSTDGYRAVLAPWIERGDVILIEWPGDAQQRPAYCDCIRRTRTKARWVAFIDTDEYLFAPDGRPIGEVLNGFEQLPALFVYWRMFGSSGHESRPPGPVPLAYTERADDCGFASGKSIVNPCLVRRVTAHLFPTWTGRTVDTDGHVVPTIPMESASCVPESRELLRVNHYWSRSMEDLHAKAKRSCVFMGAGKSLYSEEKWQRFKAFEALLHGVTDTTIIPIHKKTTDSSNRGH